MNTPRFRSLFFALGASLAVGAPSLAYAAPAAGIPTDGTIADVAERTVDSVVTIAVAHEVKGHSQVDFDPFGMGFDDSPRKQTGKGSGVIVTASGRILTNAHVVDGADDIKVTLPDGTEVDAKVLGKDTHVDIAVLQLKGKFPTLKPITFGDSSALRLGDIVLAVGDGMGIGKSVSMGIVSAKGRKNLNIEEYEDFIQTDAAINPGNSGGALINGRGELIGINTAIYSQSGGYQGVGFAVPSNLARKVMNDLIRYGEVRRGTLGYLEVSPLTPQMAEQMSVPVEKGVLVSRMTRNSAAYDAGIRPGDVIVSFNQRPVEDSSQLLRLVADSPIGSTVAVGAYREGRKLEFKIPVVAMRQRTTGR